MTMVLSEEQPSNVWNLISLSESERVMDLSEEQPAKTSFPIDVTESGITTEVSEVHPLKALDSIFFTVPNPANDETNLIGSVKFFSNFFVKYIMKVI
jgi:hypothetical protein